MRYYKLRWGKQTKIINKPKWRIRIHTMVKTKEIHHETPKWGTTNEKDTKQSTFIMKTKIIHYIPEQGKTNEFKFSMKNENNALRTNMNHNQWNLPWKPKWDIREQKPGKANTIYHKEPRLGVTNQNQGETNETDHEESKSGFTNENEANQTTLIMKRKKYAL